MNFNNEYTYKIKIILFDLDNTLVKTDDLEIFRNLEHPLYKNNDNFQQYIDSITKDLGKKDRYIFTPWELNKLKKNGLKIGIVTKSPDPYAYAIITTLYHKYNLYFDVVVAHEHVTKQKPDGEGIILALNILVNNYRNDLNNLNGNQVLYIGDSDTDIQAAYNAGTMVALRLNDDELLLEKKLKHLPEFNIRSFYDLERIITMPDLFVPFMESDSQYLKKNTPFFLWFDKYDEQNNRYPFLVAGRYFPQNSLYSLKRSFHSFSKEIVYQKESTVFSNKWLEALRLVILKETACSLIRHLNLIITCIPRRKTSSPRMESLLKQLAEYLKENSIERDCTIHIVTDLLEYSKNAVSNHKTAKTKDARFTNVKNNLIIKRKNLITDDIDKIIVIDDVVTTGASLIIATEKLKQAGAKEIIRFAFAQTVSL